MDKRIAFMGLIATLCGIFGCTEKNQDCFKTDKGTDVQFVCIKHGSFRMSVGDKWVYVDPVSQGAEPYTDYTVLPKADYIFVTHEHGDHFDAQAIADLSKDGTVVVTNPRTAEKYGKECVVMKNGDTLSLSDGWSVCAVPAYNYSEDKLNFHPAGRDNGYVLDIEGFRVYIGGDTEDIPEMADVKDIDVAFLPCNLPYTMTPEQCANAAKTVAPKVLFPYHYGQTRIEAVCELLEGSGIDVRIRMYQ